MIALALVLACHAPSADGPVQLTEVSRIDGDPEAGHGHPLAWVDEALAVGEVRILRLE